MNYAVVGTGISLYTETVEQAKSAVKEHIRDCRVAGGYSDAKIYNADDVCDRNGSPYIPANFKHSTTPLYY